MLVAMIIAKASISMITTNVLVTIITVKRVEIIDYHNIMMVTMVDAKWVDSNDYHKICWLQ